MVRSATGYKPVSNRFLDRKRDAGSSDVDGTVLVDAEHEMNDRTFVLHMNKRHRESLGGLPHLWETCDPYVTSCWRAFHTQLHRWRLDLGHRHED